MMFEEIKPLQEKEYQILQELKRVCEQKGLKYYLGFGTLLGAIRHQGFIPWDDDIDTCMNYQDYEALDKACEECLGEDFFLQTCFSDPESHLTFKKIRLNNTTCIHEDHVSQDMHHGIAIDVYPVFNVSDNKFKRTIQIYSAILYLLLVNEEPPKNHGILLRIGSSLVLNILRGNLREKVKELCLHEMTKYEGIKTKEKAFFCGNHKTCKRMYPSEVFEESIQKTFVDEEFSIPKEYDKFLSKRYGNYMELPPIEEQGVKLNHLVKIDTENSYKKYKGIYYCVKK